MPKKASPQADIQRRLAERVAPALAKLNELITDKDQSGRHLEAKMDRDGHIWVEVDIDTLDGILGDIQAARTDLAKQIEELSRHHQQLPQAPDCQMGRTDLIHNYGIVEGLGKAWQLALRKKTVAELTKAAPKK